MLPPGLVKFGAWPGRALRRSSVAGTRRRLPATLGITFRATCAGQRGVMNIPDVLQQAVILAIVPGFGLTLREPGTRQWRIEYLAEAVEKSLVVFLSHNRFPKIQRHTLNRLDSQTSSMAPARAAIQVMISPPTVQLAPIPSSAVI